jgi:hypothetical protein
MTEMDTTCGTTHCIAGWAVAVADNDCNYKKDVATVFKKVATVFLIAGLIVTIFVGSIIFQSNQSYRECIKTDRTDCILKRL